VLDTSQRRTKDLAPRRRRLRRPGRWTGAASICLGWLVVIAVAVTRLRQPDAIVVAAAGFAASAFTFVVSVRTGGSDWPAALRSLKRFLRTARRGGPTRLPPDTPEELIPLALEYLDLLKASRRPVAGVLASPSPPMADPQLPAPGCLMTRSGLFDSSQVVLAGPFDPQMSGDFSTIDMVNRLEPVGWRWIESSPAEQEFLGWTLADLRKKSFIDIIHPDDRRQAQETFRQALERGEALGLIVRIRTAHGKSRAIEVNAGARYGTNQQVIHLRCHLTDVTDKVRAERQLRLRTFELTRVNEQLRSINRELEDLKNRYTDLYENAPAMYFSLDPEGRVAECNQTMLSTLNYKRSQIIGHPYRDLLDESSWERFRSQFPEFLERGSIEEERRWVKSDGESLDVWVLGRVVRGPKDSVHHARFVAQDVTTKRRLEAELHEKNRRLARTNEELSRKNRELDEFVYVVSHDLQEPLRTLIAFSDFLLRDYGDRLEAEGQEFVQYLVGASRRMRAMIHGMLNLSRAGKVVDGFQKVDLEEQIAIIKTDLRELIRSRGAEIRIAGPLPTIWGDRDRIRQLLANLVTNGVKYNRSQEPRVEIGAIASSADRTVDATLPVDHGADATITVKDNGIGIEPQFHRTIFQLFRRLHTQEEYEGTGAGLAICNKIVQAHEGRIWVESLPGQGATFFIRLRRPPAPESATSSSPHDSETATTSFEVALDEHDAV
jgi:PAS domain S-box-containing protein